jgi:hypothetical protein
VDHLDGDAAAVPDVVRQIHGRHPTGPELALDRVSTAKRMLELVVHVGHGMIENSGEAGGWAPDRAIVRYGAAPVYRVRGQGNAAAAVTVGAIGRALGT